MGILQDGRAGEEDEEEENEEEEDYDDDVEEEETGAHEVEGQDEFACMTEDNQRATPMNVYNKHGFVVVFLPLCLKCIFSLLFHLQVLSDLKRRQAEQLERLLSHNEERLAAAERQNQVLSFNH